jgi:hypothetical protein
VERLNELNRHSSFRKMSQWITVDEGEEMERRLMDLEG